MLNRDAQCLYMVSVCIWTLHSLLPYSSNNIKQLHYKHTHTRVCAHIIYSEAATHTTNMCVYVHTHTHFYMFIL